MLKNRKPSWSFTASAVSDIDINRILRETPDDEPFVVIADSDGSPVLICIRGSYLSTFCLGDRISVCDMYLCDSWGHYWLPKITHNVGKLTAPLELGNGGGNIKTGWYIARANSNDVQALIQSKKYVRRIPVRVYVSSDLEEVQND